MFQLFKSPVWWDFNIGWGALPIAGGLWTFLLPEYNGCCLRLCLFTLPTVFFILSTIKSIYAATCFTTCFEKCFPECFTKSTKVAYERANMTDHPDSLHCTLYYFPFSLYSIMARLTLALGVKSGEPTKPVTVQLRLLNLHRDENLEEWFLLTMNPKGQVRITSNLSWQGWHLSQGARNDGWGHSHVF
jgi:hypothetical protein